jgi:hypothetical protein
MKLGVIPSRVDGEGPLSCNLGLLASVALPLTENALPFAVAIERLRGPSPSARLGMTSVIA